VAVLLWLVLSGASGCTSEVHPTQGSCGPPYYAGIPTEAAPAAAGALVLCAPPLRSSALVLICSWWCTTQLAGSCGGQAAGEVGSGSCALVHPFALCILEQHCCVMPALLHCGTNAHLVAKASSAGSSPCCEAACEKPGVGRPPRVHGQSARVPVGRGVCRGVQPRGYAWQVLLAGCLRHIWHSFSPLLVLVGLNGMCGYVVAGGVIWTSKRSYAAPNAHHTAPPDYVDCNGTVVFCDWETQALHVY
jgi:hypothetical protein